MLYTFPIQNVGDIKVYCEPEFLSTFEKLFSYCLKNTAFYNVLNSIVTSYPDFSIAFVKTKLFSSARWSSSLHQIQIKETLPFNAMLDSLVFECCNAQNHKLNNLDVKNFSNADEFATFVEEAEYDSYKLKRDIYQNGIQEGTWSLGQSQTLNEYPSLKTWMEMVKKKSNFYNGAESHFDVYVNFFNHADAQNGSSEENTVSNFCRII